MNTQRNIIRFYPNAFNIYSGNYDNMKYFRDGAQITALNLQKIGNARLLNDAVFIPPKSTYCSPKEILQGKCEHIHNIQNHHSLRLGETKHLGRLSMIYSLIAVRCSLNAHAKQHRWISNHIVLEQSKRISRLHVKRVLKCAFELTVKAER